MKYNKILAKQKEQNVLELSDKIEERQKRRIFLFNDIINLSDISITKYQINLPDVSFIKRKQTIPEERSIKN